jgi:Transposase DDE domain
MLSNKSNPFFENLKPLIDQTTKSGTHLFDLIGKCPIEKIKADKQSKYCREEITRFFVLIKLLAIPTLNTAIRSRLKGILPCGKDVLYKVKNSSCIAWRRMLYRQAKQCMTGVTSTPKEHEPWTQPCFIVDDSDIQKKGKRIEFIGRIFSHVTHRYNPGFKCLSLAYWSGKHLLHLDFSLHGELGKNGMQGLTMKQLKARYTKNRDGSLPGGKRGEEVFEKKSTQLLKMLRKARAYGFQAAYLLLDSWFFNARLMVCANKLGIHVISRPKFNQWKYRYINHSFTLGNLIKKLRRSKEIKWNKTLRMHHIGVIVQHQGVELRIFFFKEKRNGSKWQALITTDKQIGAIQAYKVYQNRWAIEVSFKDLKQYLGFGKCQSRDFDAQIADCTHSLMAYNYLSNIQAVHDYETIGHLFADVSQNWVKPTFMKRFWNYFLGFIAKLAELVQKSADDLLAIATNDDAFFSKWSNCSVNLGAET